MNSPFNGDFQLTQEYSNSHTGIDIVGIDSKLVHSVSRGTVVYADYENSQNLSQGFGKFVCIKDETGLYHYYGHLDHISVNINDTVSIGDAIGVEGNTGFSTGSHLHYEIRKEFRYATPETTINPCEFTGIPNTKGVYNDGAELNKSISKVVIYYNDGTNKTIS